MRPTQIDTPSGPSRAHLHPAPEPKGAVVLGHGAGGGVEAVDLVAASEAAVEAGFTVALVEQPYRVAGRRSPAPAKRLDEAWIAVLEHLRDKELADLPMIVGGRSLGARVACRTVEETGAAAVLCLAFPLLPPRRPSKPPQSRLPELEAVERAGPGGPGRERPLRHAAARCEARSGQGPRRPRAESGYRRGCRRRPWLAREPPGRCDLRALAPGREEKPPVLVVISALLAFGSADLGVELRETVGLLAELALGGGVELAERLRLDLALLEAPGPGDMAVDEEGRRPTAASSC